MSRGKYRDLSPPDFLSVSVLHLVVFCHEKPAIAMTESDDFGVFDVSSGLIAIVLEPFGEPLDSKASRPETDSDVLG